MALLALFVVPSHVGWGWFAYRVLAFATVATMRSTRREPGFWLGRRIVRRAVVLADCIAMRSTDLGSSQGAAPGGFLILGLLLLNVVLGRATQRLATAPDAHTFGSSSRGAHNRSFCVDHCPPCVGIAQSGETAGNLQRRISDRHRPLPRRRTTARAGADHPSLAAALHRVLTTRLEQPGDRLAEVGRHEEGAPPGN